MNRIDRLTAILIHLQSRKIVKAASIAERFNISLRTVYRDIRALEEAGVPIGAEPGKGYYILEGYQLPPVMFTRDEASALLIGGKLMNKYSDKSINTQFEDALYKIRSVLDIGEKDHLDFLNSRIEVLTFNDSDNDSRNNDRLLEIQSVLGKETLIIIEYHSFYKDELTHRIIEPIGLCFYASNWHLIAFCRLRSDYRDFRVDRIKKLTITNDKFRSDMHSSLQTLIKKIVITEDLKCVTVKFQNKTAKYVNQQRYYFGFVAERKEKAYTEMDFMVSSLSYIARWLLAFIDEVEVVAPVRLKKLMHSYSKRLLAHHG
ncbi:MAG: YafY family protein [Desulfobacteraceae bacterium]|jgi:predicted DNA-binding transcriptional regulator YafY